MIRVGVSGAAGRMGEAVCEAVEEADGLELAGRADPALGTELARLRSEPVSDEELKRAKESVKGRLVLSSESTAARMSRIARATLFDLPIDSLDEMLAKVDAVTVEDLAVLAAELYGPERLSAACVGREESRFRDALAPVSETLVAT